MKSDKAILLLQLSYNNHIVWCPKFREAKREISWIRFVDKKTPYHYQSGRYILAWEDPDV